MPTPNHHVEILLLLESDSISVEQIHIVWRQNPKNSAHLYDSCMIFGDSHEAHKMLSAILGNFLRNDNEFIIAELLQVFR